MAYRITRQHRYNRLINAGMLPFEAQALSKVPYRRAPYIKQMMRDRIELLTPIRHQADILNWSPTEYRKQKKIRIYDYYVEQGMTYTKLKRPFGKVRPDVWQLFREARDEAIATGKWDETPRRRRKRYEPIRINKGNVQAQKERRRERERTKREFDRMRGNR